MSGRKRAFNPYLAVALVALAIVSLGCQSAEERKRQRTYTTLWMHLEIPEGTPSTNRMTEAQVAGVRLTCSSIPFLTEENLSKAAIVPTPDGGQALRLEFDEHGQLVIDSVTSQYRQRRVLFFAEFGEKSKSTKKKTATRQRWLAAPKITRRVTDGVIVFAPDASPEELNEIVVGLNNAAKEAKKPWVF